MTDTASELLDIHKVQQVYLTYAAAMDSREWQLMKRCFEPDARVELTTVAGEVAGAAGLDASGWIALVERIEQTLDAAQHYIYPPLVKIDGNRAFARAYFVVQHVVNALAPDGFFLLGGWYDGELLKRADEWRLVHHRIIENWSSGNPRVLGLDLPTGAAIRTDVHRVPPWIVQEHRNRMLDRS